MAGCTLCALYCCSSKEQVAFLVNADGRGDLLFTFDLQNLAQLEHNDDNKTIYDVVNINIFPIILQL